jgi:indolepyruvate ferredoxin oxidoreductase
MLGELKWLRGARFDPFCSTAERRAERQLIADYERMVETLPRALSPAVLDAAIAIAALPMRIQGFGPVKAARIAEVKDMEQKLLLEFFVGSAKATPGRGIELVAAE